MARTTTNSDINSILSTAEGLIDDIRTATNGIRALRNEPLENTTMAARALSTLAMHAADLAAAVLVLQEMDDDRRSLETRLRDQLKDGGI